MALITRTGKGSKLTIADMDGNLEYLVTTLSGSNSITGSISHESCTATGIQSISEGQGSSAVGDYSRAHGQSSSAIANASFATGYNAKTGGNFAHSSQDITNGVLVTGGDLTSEILGGHYIYIYDLADNSTYVYQVNSVSYSSSPRPETTITLTDTNVTIANSVRYMSINAGPRDTTGTSTISGLYSFSGNNSTITLGKNSTSLGDSTICYGNASTAFGIGTISIGTGQTVVGSYNEFDSTSPFIVGNGSNGAPSNAFKVTTNNSIVLPNTVSGTPNWTGQEGELVLGDDGSGNFVIWVYLSNNWMYTLLTL